MNPALTKKIHNRGEPPESFIQSLVEWAKTAPDALFAPNPLFDIYAKVRNELGPYPDLLYRKGVMLDVLLVLAGFESSWDWREGVDTSRLGETTPQNAEAGAFQTSYDARRLDVSLSNFLAEQRVTNGVLFQRKTKNEKNFALTFMALLLRIDVKNPQRLANGPLYKGDERHFIRSSLRDAKNSIYPWLSREAVSAFTDLLRQ